VINIAPSTLHTMLKQVRPHMASDGYLPALNALHIETRDGHLFVVASDRHTLAVAHATVIESETWRAMISADDLPAVLAWLEAVGSSDAVGLAIGGRIAPESEITLTSTAGALTVCAESGTGFPQWRMIVRGQLTAEQQPVPGSAWTTKLLARWRHAGKVLEAAQAAPGKPIVFADSESSFIGLQMPVRMPEDVTMGTIAERWLDIITPIAFVDHQPYRLDVQWSDKDGDVWEYTGRNEYSEPLMRVVGIEDDDHTLGRLVTEYGPITPVGDGAGGAR
jgi:DNA polymerase III beta subunit, central domain